MPHLTRRQAILAGSLAAAAFTARSEAAAARAQPQPPAKPEGNPAYAGDAHRGPCVIASANGLRAVARATELMNQGYDPADCIVQGVRIQEDDPDDQSVGLGGLPNEEGIVELDASVMHGPTHKSGAVAGMRNIKNAAMVALIVLRRTNHCLIVGEGAKRFALEHGFPEENLLTEKSRQAWLKWKANMSRDDAWLNDDDRDTPIGKTWEEPGHPGMSAAAAGDRQGLAYTTGTIHCSAVTAAGDVSSCTTTSGLSWKIPGRVGDSPIIGAGNYCDNEVGAAGLTGRGESAIVNLSAYTMVFLMEKGMTPTEAALEAARRVDKHTKEKRLKGPDGRVKFGLSFYAVRKDGAYGGASMTPGGQMAVCDAAGARLVPMTSVYEK